MVRMKRSSVGDPLKPPGPLTQQILESRTVAPSRKRGLDSGSEAEEADRESVNLLDDRLSRRILKIAKRQVRPDVEETSERQNSIRKRIELLDKDESSEESDNEKEFAYSESEDDGDTETVASLEAFDSLFPSSQAARDELASMMCRARDEKWIEIKNRFARSGDAVVKDLDPEVLDMYRKVARALTVYRSGKVPKAFKVIPRLSNWEQVLYILEPEKWTNHAMYQAARIFSSNMTSKSAERFYNLVLLPRIRDDLTVNKKLNPLLYQALIKCIYKPAAFFKGILLSLIEDGCTQREATVISSVIMKASIPVLHAAAAMTLLAQAEFSPITCHFLYALVEKKYTLPVQTIDSLVNFFIRFVNDEREMPVVWHQLLLSLVRNYKANFSEEQKDVFMEVISQHRHHLITAEIRRELVTAAGQCQQGSSTVTPMEVA